MEVLPPWCRGVFIDMDQLFTNFLSFWNDYWIILGSDLLGDGPRVEGVRPLRGDQAQRPGQVLLHQAIPGLPIGLAIVLAQNAGQLTGDVVFGSF